MQRVYSGIEDFYSADERRRNSSEADFGFWWANGGRLPYRVSYVQATGEVYAVALGVPGYLEVLGVVPPDDDRIYYRTLDRILEGWPEVCGRPNSLQWVRDRLATAEGEAS